MISNIFCRIFSMARYFMVILFSCTIQKVIKMALTYTYLTFVLNGFSFTRFNNILEFSIFNIKKMK
jgi:hypothetical protein